MALVVTLEGRLLYVSFLTSFVLTIISEDTRIGFWRRRVYIYIYSFWSILVFNLSF